MGERADEVCAAMLQRQGHVHFVGVCGVGMAGLAHLLRVRGLRVSGCDLYPNALGDWLRKDGITVFRGHDPSHLLSGVDWLVRSAAVPLDCPEVIRAAESGMPVLARGEVLPRLLAEYLSVAVAGTHGKTTTGTFTVELLRSAGLDPAWCIGGESDALGGVAGAGSRDVVGRRVMVVEADESDGSLALYSPDVGVVTGIERDHMEQFGSVSALRDCFRTFVTNTSRRIVYCADDPLASEVCGEHERATAYGFADGAQVRADGLHEGGNATTFNLVVRDSAPRRVTLPVPGAHNVMNALAAAAVCLELGILPADIEPGIRRLRLPRRRFERITEGDGTLVISDYAHHPTEIRSLVRTAVALGRRRVIAVFQPHRYTRTLTLGPEFPGAFRGVDELFLLPVYGAGEARLEGGCSSDLCRHFGAARDPDVPPPRLVGSLEEAWRLLRGDRRKGDVLLVVGAGDVDRIAAWAREEIETGQTR